MNKPTPEVTVRVADWSGDLKALRSVREAVFVIEQEVAPEEEWDDDDADCLHVLAETAKRDAVGTGRLDRRGKIGRMAVLEPYRGFGVGGMILERLREEARKAGIRELILHAQTHAEGFYSRYGFRPEGEVFLEANIPHIRMRCSLVRNDDD